MCMAKLVILSAPSGSGKTTLTRRLLSGNSAFAFSISATSRAPRAQEKEGIDYYFLTTQEFLKKRDQQEFLEWEEVYPGTYYGTLRSEVERLWAQGMVVFFDIDVEGALRLKKNFGDAALAVYIQAPSRLELERRLRTRGSDSEEKIQIRLQKAAQEARRAPLFDAVVVNDTVERASAELNDIVNAFLQRK